MKFILLNSPANPPLFGTIRRSCTERWNELADIQPVVSARVPREKTLSLPDCAGWITPVLSKEVRALTRNRPFPIVNYSNHYGACADAVNVLLDENEIASLAAEHLTGRGYRSFAYTGFAKVPGFPRERGAYFRGFLNARGFDAREHYLDPPPTEHPLEHEEAFQSEVRELVRSWTVPTGIFAANDELAGRILRTLREDGRDGSPFHAVVGVDDRFFHGENGFDAARLTSVRPAFGALGRRAAEILHGAMADPVSRPPGSVVRISGALLVERESTCGFGMGHPVVNRMARWIRAAVNEGRSPSVAELARKFQLKPRAASALFANNASVSFREFTMRQRLVRAAHLLHEADLPIGEIAQRCGFGKQGDLNEAFQRHFHRTPGEFRRHGQGQGDPTAAAAPRPCAQAANR